MLDNDDLTQTCDIRPVRLSVSRDTESRTGQNTTQKGLKTPFWCGVCPCVQVTADRVGQGRTGRSGQQKKRFFCARCV